MADYAIHEETLTGISNVIRKKDGTVALIDPADYADRINLMGMLEEKTASGAIAHITDGADEVPLKSWEVEISPTLSGKSAIECTQTGKNLVDVSTATGTGTIWFHYDNGIELKKGATYTFSCGNYGTGSIALYGIDHSTQVAYAYISASSAQVTYTPTENITVCPRIYQSGLTISNLANVQLEVGSTATTYEPYTAPTVSTVNLGRTIHGGTVDVVKGQGTETHKRVVFDGTEQWQKSGSALNGYYTPMPTQGLQTYTAVLCNKATMASSSSDYYNNYEKCYVDYYFAINLDPDVVGNTVAQFKQWLSDQYAGGTPLEIVGKQETDTNFTFTPITPTPETALGVNNFWADEGDNTEVTYRSMGTVYQYPEGEGVSF